MAIVDPATVPEDYKTRTTILSWWKSKWLWVSIIPELIVQKPIA